MEARRLFWAWSFAWMWVTWFLPLVIVGSSLFTRRRQLGRVASEQLGIERLSKDRPVGNRIQGDLSRHEQHGEIRVPGQRVDRRPQGETIEPRHHDIGDDKRDIARVRRREQLEG